jgi:hypothetical protein
VRPRLRRLPAAPLARLSVGLVALLVALGPGAAVADGVGVGSTAPSQATTFTCGSSALFVQNSTAAAPGYGIDASGVITSWSVMGSTVPAPMALEVLRGTGTNAWVVQAASAPATATAGRLTTFAARIPVTTGSTIALYVPPGTGASCATTSVETTDVIGFATGVTSAAPGTAVSTTSSNAKFRLNVSAHIEPDADGDGWGDLTQDACPTLANSHTDCVAPDTLLAVRPGTVTTRSKKARATVVFYASESGTTHTCAVDAGAPAPCASPYRPQLSLGRHTIRITSTDAVGNVDATPLAVTLKVKRKR